MTQEEFDNTGYHAGMKVEYQQMRYLIAQVNFEERLFGLVEEGDLYAYERGLAQADWVRCENCTLLN
jgi:hypothetical protein